MTAWGDGFDNDGWDELNAVTDWDRCAPEEYIRVFPGLLRQGAGFPPCLAAHLLERLLALQEDAARNLSRQRSMLSRRRLAALIVRLTSLCREDRSAKDGRIAAALVGLERLHGKLARGDCPPFDARLAAELAFWIGIHPAYVWPEALVLHDHFTTVGWLGQAARARCSFMLGDVASYLVATLAVDDTGTVRVLDPALAPYLGSATLQHRLLGVAHKRLGRAGFGIRFLAGMDRRLPHLAAGQAGA